MGDAQWAPRGFSEIEYSAAAIRPLLAYKDQNRQFLDVVLVTSGDIESTRRQRELYYADD